MAVPGMHNGLGDDEAEEENALFEEDGVMNYESDTPPQLRDLRDAIANNDIDALRLALDNLTGSIDEAVEDGDTALHLCCLYGHLPLVQLLLERGANIEATDEDGAIPLHDASASGFLDIVQLLINSANNPECVKRMMESVDAEGDTPLHHAARGGHIDIIRLLLASGASPTKTNSFEKTPSELAEPNTEAREILEAAAGDVA